MKSVDFVNRSQQEKVWSIYLAFLAKSFVLSMMSGASERLWLRMCPRCRTDEQNREKVICYQLEFVK